MEQIKKYNFFTPKLSDAAHVLQKELRECFVHSSVNVVQCPDLSKSPVQLAAPGISGNAKLMQVGGVKNLLPLPNKEKKYNLHDISKQIGADSSLYIGAGAGPFNEIGRNSELMVNIKFEGENHPPKNFGFTAKTLDDDQSTHVLEEHKSTRFGIIGDFFISDGKSGEVLEINAKGRKGREDLITAIHSILSSAWKNESIGLGGVVMVSEGKSKIHVMPEFSSIPLNSEEDVNNWLKFYEVGSPFVSAGVLITNSPSELDIRPIHFHGVNRKTMEGGHFHTDTTPDEVEYLAYLSFGEEFVRYDQPV